MHVCAESADKQSLRSSPTRRKPSSAFSSRSITHLRTKLSRGFVVTAHKNILYKISKSLAEFACKPEAFRLAATEL